MERNREFQRFSPPLNEGEEVDVRIESVGAKGDGVAKVKGFVVFVPSVREGEEVRIRITRVLKKYAFAEVVKRLEPGQGRQEEPQEEAEEEAEGEEGFGEEEESFEEEPKGEAEEKESYEDTENF